MTIGGILVINSSVDSVQRILIRIEIKIAIPVPILETETGIEMKKV